MKLRGESISGQLDGTIPSTSAEQAGSDALIDASHIDLEVMGSMDIGGGGGGFGFGGQGGASGAASADSGSSDMPQLPEGFDPSDFGGEGSGGALAQYGLSLGVFAAALVFALLYRRRPRRR